MTPPAIMPATTTPATMPPSPDKHVPGEETVLKAEPMAFGKGSQASFKIGLKMA